MKYSMIKYQFTNGTAEDWHREIDRFIAALDSDPELKGKISYRCMKNRDDQRRYSRATSFSNIAKRPGRSRAAT